MTRSSRFKSIFVSAILIAYVVMVQILAAKYHLRVNPVGSNQPQMMSGAGYGAAGYGFAGSYESQRMEEAARAQYVAESELSDLQGRALPQ